MQPKAQLKNVDISAQARSLWAVPQAKRWFVYGLFKEATVGTPKIYRTTAAMPALGTAPAIASMDVDILQTTIATFVYLGLTLNQGESLNIQQGNVADTSINISIHYAEYDIDV